MAPYTPFNTIFGDDFMAQFDTGKTMPFDMKDIMETQRKNIQAITDAQQAAYEGMQAIAQKQAEVMSQLLEDNNSMAKELMAEASPEQKMAKNAELCKKIYEKGIQNVKEISEMLNKSHTEAGEILNKRVSASMNEIKSSIEKKKKAA